MSTVQAGDVIAVYRSGTLYQAPADMSTVQDTDLIVVGRGNTPYKCTFADWKASQGKAPAIHDVLLADSPEAGRFTSGTFASTVHMTEEGVPPASKGIKGWVEGSLNRSATSSAIASVSGTGAAGSEGTSVDLQFQPTSAASVNAQSLVYGKIAQDANNNANHPVFQWAAGLRIGGHADWYIPAKNEMEILYRNLKPNAAPNDTASGNNYNSVPPHGNYTSGSPAQTTSTLFQSGNLEAFSAIHHYWTATEKAGVPNYMWRQTFYNGSQDDFAGKINKYYARAIRRVPFTGSEPAIGSPYEGGYFGGLISTAGHGAAADYALIVAPNAGGTYGYTGGSAADPYVLTFNTDKDLASFAAGDAVTEQLAAGGAGDATGTVSSVDVTAKTITLAAGVGSGTWDVGNTVKGPSKPVSNVKLFCTLDASLNVTDLQSLDPGFTAVTGAGPYSIKFPATLPSGNPPDTDLPAGTTITTEVQATNTAGTATKTSNTATPA